MEKNKILHIGVIQQTPDMGGAETYMLSLMESFIKQGNSVSLATNLKALQKPSLELGIKIYTIPVIMDVIGDYKGLLKTIFFLPYAIYFYSHLLQTFKKNGVEVLLMSGFSDKLLVTYLSRFIKLPVVWIEYSRLESVFNNNFGLPRFLYNQLHNTARTIITASQYSKRGLIQDTQIPSDKIVVIPCGTTLSGKIVKQEQKKTVIIGNVSRLTREKGQQVLLRAIPHVISIVPNVHFLIIGQGPDELYFKSIIKELKIEKYVDVVGYVRDLLPYYQKMDLFIFPTIWELEGFGLVSIEAMSSGIPVIASDLGPIPEIVTNDVGIVVPPENVVELANAITELVLDENKRQKMGKEARKRVEALYTLENASKNTLDILKKVL